MLKRLPIAAVLIGLLSPAFAAGTIPFSLTQQNDEHGVPLAGCKLFIIQAGTTSTPQNAFSDTALTVALANPIVCDASGRLPQFFLADGSIKIRLTKSTGVNVVTADNILVVGNSSGGGGGGGLSDATTVMATGDLKVRYGTGVLTGFVRANGRTIGSISSGATERANSDTETLFEYLWNTDANLAVSGGGRGISATADFAADKAIALPDWRGRAVAGLDDMGNSASGRLHSTFLGSTPTVLGAAGGTMDRTLLTGNLPAYTPTGTVTNGAITITQDALKANAISSTGGGAFSIPINAAATISASQAASSFTGAAQGGVSNSFGILPPMMLATIYLKL